MNVKQMQDILSKYQPEDDLVFWVEDEDGDPQSMSIEPTDFSGSNEPVASVHFNVGFSQKVPA
ncbi:MAG TPA: hypothetical protein VF077_08900 [Nitrospiraceae bacterium]